MIFRKACLFAGLIFNGVGPVCADEPVRVVPEGTIRDARQPQVAVDPQGKVFVVFGSGKVIYCVVSEDGGRSFAQPVKVGEAGHMALGLRRGPRVAATEKAVVVTAVCGELGGGKDGDVLAWRSTDGGATWQGPAKVNDEPASAREGLHGMAAGPAGELFCVWLDLRNRRTEIYGSFSPDGGATWPANQLVYRSPSGSVCECCHPSAAFDAQGNLYVMWRNQLKGARDMYVVESRGGTRQRTGERRFSSARKLGQGTWVLDACPMDGGALAAHSPSKLTTVWRRDKQVFRSDAGTGEQLLGHGEQPWAAADPKGTYVVWISRRPGDLFLLTPDARRPRKLAAAANDPAIAGPLTGQGPVVAVWETGQHGSATVMAARLTD